MRAVKSVLDAISRHKTTCDPAMDEEEDEESVVLKCLMDVNLPKFVSEDVGPFNNIVGDLFHKEKREREGEEIEEKKKGPRDDLAEAVRLKCKEGGLQATKWFVSKVVHD